MDKFLIISLSIIIQFLILSLNFNPYDNKHLKLCFPSCQLFRKVLFGQWASCWATASSSSIPSLHKWGSGPRESSQFTQVLSAADSLSPCPCSPAPWGPDSPAAQGFLHPLQFPNGSLSFHGKHAHRGMEASSGTVKAESRFPHFTAHWCLDLLLTSTSPQTNKPRFNESPKWAQR